MASFYQQHWLLKIIITAVLYYLSTLIGLELTSSINNVSFFTPSSGVALGALFLFGPVAIFGIVLGAFIHELMILSNQNLTLLVFSLIPSIQAYISYRFFKTKLNRPSSFTLESDTIRFYTLSPFFSLISATLFLSVLFFTQDINEGHALSTFFTLWIGNVFGVLIATPLFLALFSNQNEWNQRRISVGLSLLVLLSITIFIMQDAVTREESQITQKLSQTNYNVNAEIDNTLKQYEKNLQAINIFFLSTYHATPNEINDFLRKLNLKKNDSVYGYGWFGFADLVNTKADSQYGFHTLKPYPFTLDKAPIRVIQEQFEECTIGSYLEVHQNKNDTFSLYRNIEASISSIDNICASEHLGGVAYVDIDLNSLVNKIKQKLNIKHIDIQLIGIQNNQITPLLHPTKVNVKDVKGFSFIPTSESLITYKNTFWTLKLTGNKRYVSLHSNWSTWWLLLVSLLFTTLSAFGLLLLTAKKLQIETIVDKKTDQLRKINNQLSEQIQQQQQQEILIKMQSRILEMIAKGEPLSTILNQLCLYTENQIFEGFASINTYDENNQKVELVASPTLESQNEQYFVDLDLNQQNPSVEALKTQTQQIVENINDSLSSKLNSTQSYWATPIVSPQKEVLGVLTITLANSRSPSTLEQELMNVSASLACISIEQHNNSKQLNKLSNAVKSSPNGIVITSIKGVIEYANPYFCEYIGIEEENVLGQYLSKFVQDANDSNNQEFDWDYSLSLGESQREYMGIRSNGDIYWCKQSIASMFDPLENSQHVLSIHQDLTDEHTTLKFLKQQASHDSLTGLFNKTEFEYQINKLISKASLTNIHTVAYLDLDNFKSINEQCGYPAGDQLLRSISTQLDNRLRKTDFLSRIGGDSFGIIFEQCPAKKAKSILNGLIEAISSYEFTWNEQVYSLSASVGLVEMNDSETNKDELLKNADTACYLAKQEGRQQVHIYHDEIHDKKIDIVKHNWLETLNKALTQDQFILFCQPILHLATDKVSHFEILLRLNSEQNEIIPSRSFVSDAERLNLMPKIDRWVISNALKWLKSRPSDNNTLFIKLSGQTLDITFKPWLVQQLNKSKIDASRLCFVIPETVSLKNSNNLVNTMTSIISVGCQFGIDDFSYYSLSFSSLKKLPVSYIKIDGQLIKNIEQDLIDKAMVKSINDIVHISGKKTIADFTKNENIKSIVSSIEVDYIQGSYSGPPVNINTL